MRHILIFLLFNTTIINGQNSEIFGHLFEGVSIINYLNESNTTSRSPSNLGVLHRDLNALDLEPSLDNVAPIANDTLLIESTRKTSLYKSKDNLTSLYMEECGNLAELRSRWSRIYRKQGWYSGYGYYYFKFDTVHVASLNATFRSKNHIFNIQTKLPFHANGYDSLSVSQWETIDTANTKILKVLKTLSDHLTSNDNKLFFPSNGRLFNRQFTSTERLTGFVNFWTEVKYNFAFFDQVPELDWDQILIEYLPEIQADQSNSSYYNLLLGLCAKLNDGHTNIYLPLDLNSKKFRPSVELSIFDDGIYVINSSEKYRNTLPLGSKITRVNGVEIFEYLREAEYPFISSSTPYIKKKNALRNMMRIPLDSVLYFEFKDPKGKQGHCKFSNLEEDDTPWIRASDRSGYVDFEMLNPHTAYLAINTFGSASVVEDFENVVDSIRGAERLIIDLRNNGGGNSSYAYEILKYFSTKPFLTSKWMTREHKAAYKAWGTSISGDPTSPWEEEAKATSEGNYWHTSPPDTITPYYDKYIDLPITVLIGNNTASAAEDFLVAADDIGITETVGDFTYGSTGQPLHFRLPGDGSARICTKKDTYPDGREFVGYGIKPKHIVRPGVDDVLNDIDVVIEYALKLK